MSDEARELLGIDSEADQRAVEEAYWRGARELARRGATDPEAGIELERLNQAYQTLSRLDVPRRRRRAGGGVSWLRRVAVAAVVLIAVAGGVSFGLSYRTQIGDQAVRGLDEAQEGWDRGVTWIDETLAEDPTPTPLPQDAPTR